MGTRIVRELVERMNGAQMRYRDATVAILHMIQSKFGRYRWATMSISTDCKQRSKKAALREGVKQGQRQSQQRNELGRARKKTSAQILLFAPGGPAVWVKFEGLRQTTAPKRKTIEQNRAVLGRGERWKFGDDPGGGWREPLHCLALSHRRVGG